MARIGQAGSTLRRLMRKHPDELEGAFWLTLTQEPDLYRAWSFDGTDLVVDNGPKPEDPDDVIWGRVRVRTRTTDVRLGGVWGWPCSENVHGVVSVRIQAVAEFLVLRGWVMNGVDGFAGDYLLSPPPNGRDRDVLGRCLQLPLATHPDPSENTASPSSKE